MRQATERASEVRGWASGLPWSDGGALCEGALLGSLERHSQGAVLGKGLSWGKGVGGGVPGVIPKPSGQTVGVRWAGEVTTVILPHR